MTPYDALLHLNRPASAPVPSDMVSHGNAIDLSHAVYRLVDNVDQLLFRRGR